MGGPMSVAPPGLSWLFSLPPTEGFPSWQPESPGPAQVEDAILRLTHLTNSI